MPRKGINKAIKAQYDLFENRRLFSDKEYSIGRTCIFISHKKEDTAKAREIANYIIDCGIDVFFDENDAVLSNPETNQDPIKVTNAINNALSKSTHMLCVISDKTKESWWVPYEIGYVSHRTSFLIKNVGVLLIKDITKLPDYLFLSTKIETTIELDSFLKNASNGETFLLEKTKLFSEIQNHRMKNILK